MKCFKVVESKGAFVLCLVGPAGAGKETLGKLFLQLLSAYNPIHLETSGLIKTYLKKHENSPAGKTADRLRESMSSRVRKEGSVITSNLDDAPVCEMMDLEITNAAIKGSKIIILDGFPRSPEQGKCILGAKRVFVANLLITEDESVARAAQRITEAIELGKDPRADDAEPEVRKRYATFKRDTRPAIKMIRDTNPAIIENFSSTAPLRFRATQILRHIPIISTRDFGLLMRRFSNPHDEVYKIIQSKQVRTLAAPSREYAPTFIPDGRAMA